MGKLKVDAPENTPFIYFERDFDAPRELVHRAHLDPDLVTQWLGPRAYEMTLDKWDARAGGEYRYIHHGEQGTWGFHGVFHSIDIDNMVQTFEFEGVPGHVSLDAVSLEDLGDGRTRLKGRSVFQSVEDRDGMVQAGMATGMEEGYERLEELTAGLRVPAA